MTMKGIRVSDIVLPYTEDLRIDPCVEMGDPIIRAIELMVNNNRQAIAVMRSGRPIGKVRLTDAFKKVGLLKPPFSQSAAWEVEY